VSDYFREPKKVRTRPELEKSCRMLREHNEKLKAHNAELDGFITEYQKRELDFQDRIEVLECEVDMWRKHVVELEETNRAYKDAWSVNILTERIDQLEPFCERFVNAYPDWRDEYEALGEAK